MSGLEETTEVVDEETVPAQATEAAEGAGMSVFPSACSRYIDRASSFLGQQSGGVCACDVH